MSVSIISARVTEADSGYWVVEGREASRVVCVGIGMVWGCHTLTAVTRLRVNS